MILERDALARYLFDRSSFTPTQLDTYLANSFVEDHKTNLNERIGMRDGRRVSKGAYLRTLKQAEETLREAVCTLILSEYLGILEEGVSAGIIRAGDILATMKGKEITPEHASKIMGVIEAMTKRVVGR